MDRKMIIAVKKKQKKTRSHSRKWVPLKKLLITVNTHFDNYALHIHTYTHIEICFQKGHFFSFQN